MRKNIGARRKGETMQTVRKCKRHIIDHYGATLTFVKTGRRIKWRIVFSKIEYLASRKSFGSKLQAALNAVWSAGEVM